MSYDEVVATRKWYDNALDLQQSTTSGEKVLYNTVTNPADDVVCSHPKMSQTKADWWKKKRDQQPAQLKRAGRCKDPETKPGRRERRVTFWYHFVSKIKMVQGKVDHYKSRLVVDCSKQVGGQTALLLLYSKPHWSWSTAILSGFWQI